MARAEDERSMSEIERELGAIDETELREAEELARALSHGTSGATGEEARRMPGRDDAPGREEALSGEKASIADVLELSALLRVSAQLELSPQRQRAIFEELENAQKRKQRTPERQRSFRWWWLLPLPLPLAVGALLLFSVTKRPNGTALHDTKSEEAAPAHAGVGLPEPPPSLLAAQARAIAGTLSGETEGVQAAGESAALALADYDRELGQYRGRWLSALHDQYRP